MTVGTPDCPLGTVPVDEAASTAAGSTVTFWVWLIGVPLMVADTVLVPAPVDDRVPVATPLALVVPVGWVSALPLPVAARTTVAPLIGFPEPSRAVTVMVVELEPVLAVRLKLVTVRVDWLGLTAPATT